MIFLAMSIITVGDFMIMPMLWFVLEVLFPAMLITGAMDYMIGMIAALIKL